MASNNSNNSNNDNGSSSNYNNNNNNNNSSSSRGPVENDVFDHFYQNFRRFTDRHISSMLHSLIGLPSMLSPPSGQTWVIIDEDLKPGSDVNSLGWKKERAYSDGEGQLDGKTMKEIRELKANWIAQRGTNEGDGGAGGGGRRGNVTAEGDKSKAESTSPSSELSPS